MYSRSWPRIDLSGTWSFAYSLEPPSREIRQAADVLEAGLVAGPAQVPGNLELDLLAAGIIGEPFYGHEHDRAQAVRARPRLVLAHLRRPGHGGPHGGAASSRGWIALPIFMSMAQWIDATDNMLIEHVLRLDDLLEAGPNEILVHIRPAVEEAKKYDYPPGLNHLRPGYESLYVRKAPHMYGWDIMPRAVSAGHLAPGGCSATAPPSAWSTPTLETQSIAADHATARLALHYQAALDDLADQLYEIVVQGRCGESSFEARRARALWRGGHGLRRAQAPPVVAQGPRRRQPLRVPGAPARRTARISTPLLPPRHPHRAAGAHQRHRPLRPRRVLLPHQRGEGLCPGHQLGAGRRLSLPRRRAHPRDHRPGRGGRLQRVPLLGRQRLRGRPLLRPVRRKGHHGLAGLRHGLRRLSAGRGVRRATGGRGAQGGAPPAPAPQPRALGRRQRVRPGL